MSELNEARLEILQKVADGEISPEEAGELIRQLDEEGGSIAVVKRRIREIGRRVKEAAEQTFDFSWDISEEGGDSSQKKGDGRKMTRSEESSSSKVNSEGGRYSAEAQYHYKTAAKNVRRIEAPMPHLAQGGPVEGEVDVVRRKQSDVSISIDYAVKADGKPAGKSFLKRMKPKAVLKDGVVSLAPPEIDLDGLPASIESAQMRYEIAAPEGIEFELSAEML